MGSQSKYTYVLLFFPSVLEPFWWIQANVETWVLPKGRNNGNKE